ncbi:MAG: protein-L-isoaspartate(D-aspartate) O-methyltransferase [Phycisphaerae bacterium]
MPHLPHFLHASDRMADSFAAARESMVHLQLAARDITDPRVLRVMATVPRHLFVPASHAGQAYDDCALPSAAGQTISQPYMVARMTEELEIQPGVNILEIGTGTGYQTAILALLAQPASPLPTSSELPAATSEALEAAVVRGEGAEQRRGMVYSIERIAELTEYAAKRLATLHLTNIQLRVGDGSLGWPAPIDGRPPRFERILVTAGVPTDTPALLEQLLPGGIAVLPAGDANLQQLYRITRRADGSLEHRMLLDCRFVPLLGSGGWALPSEI